MFFAGLVASALVTSAAAQTAASARATANVDLAARLKEVQASPKLTEDLFKVGQKVSQFCANCHGEGGNSTKAEIPNLAGQNPSYLLEQLRKFADGRRRNEFMEGMIKALSVDEKVGMVLFYGRQHVLGHKAQANAALIPKGKDYFSKICFRCHGDDGHGNDAFARIAGQQPLYLSNTLKNYRAGTGGRTDPLMAASTKLMTDADLDAVVAFVASMD